MLQSKNFYDIHPILPNRKHRVVDVFRSCLLFCLGGFTILYFSAEGWALPTIDQLLPSNEQLNMIVNKSSIVRLNKPVKRVSIVTPDIADVQIMDEKEILLTAQSVGETTLVVWLEDDSVRTIDVVVRINTRQITEAIQHTMPDEAIEVMPMNQGVALRGQVQGVGKLDQAIEIANSYAPQVVNLMNVPGVQQVLLKVRVAEVARSFNQEFGVNFQVLGDSFSGTNMLGGLVSGTLDQPGLSVSDAATLFMGIPNSNITSVIQALEEKGLMRILAEPNLVARSGETASFLAGGEFPVPVVQGGGMSNAVTIEYKEFGVRLKFTPTVLDTQNIRLDISPEVSDLDFTQGIEISGFQVPTVVTRRAQTVVNLRDGQSFAIAGLISKSKQKTKRKVPLVGDIPIFGGLFQGGNLTDKETELLIMVTPFLVASMSDGQSIKMPGDSVEGKEPYPFEEPKPTYYQQTQSGLMKKNEMRMSAPSAETSATETPNVSSEEIPVYVEPKSPSSVEASPSVRPAQSSSTHNEPIPAPGPQESSTINQDPKGIPVNSDLSASKSVKEEIPQNTVPKGKTTKSSSPSSKSRRIQVPKSSVMTPLSLPVTYSPPVKTPDKKSSQSSSSLAKEPMALYSYQMDKPVESAGITQKSEVVPKSLASQGPNSSQEIVVSRETVDSQEPYVPIEVMYPKKAVKRNQSAESTSSMISVEPVIHQQTSRSKTETQNGSSALKYGEKPVEMQIITFPLPVGEPVSEMPAKITPQGEKLKPRMTPVNASNPRLQAIQNNRNQ